MDISDNFQEKTRVLDRCIESVRELGQRALVFIFHSDQPVRSFNLPLCDTEFVLTPQEHQKLREDLAGLARARHNDAPVPSDIRKVR